jgi:hypothetical protein
MPTAACVFNLTRTLSDKAIKAIKAIKAPLGKVTLDKMSSIIPSGDCLSACIPLQTSVPNIIIQPKKKAVMATKIPDPQKLEIVEITTR